MQFVIDRNNVMTQWLGRLFLAFGVLFSAFVAVTSLIDEGLGFGTAVIVAMSVIGFCVFVPWSWRRSGIGAVERDGALRTFFPSRKIMPRYTPTSVVRPC